ncbi:MAG: biotin synthase BioB [Clostridia bacterium]
MDIISKLKAIVLGGGEISAEQALALYDQDTEKLGAAANEIRKHFCGDSFDFCTIINAKSGKCSENCKYCAQSAHHNTNCEVYSLRSSEDVVAGAIKNEGQGIKRYSLVTSGRKISDSEVDKVCEIVKDIKKVSSVHVCGSFGLLDTPQYEKLAAAGLTRIHNNLETSRDYFPKMCTTHSFDDKLNSISMATKAGLNVCSGGIFGIGESVKDRISLAFSLKEIGVTSVPINLLNPIKGTPCENNTPLSSEELCKIVAVFRFILPCAFIRVSGGRSLLEDKGRQAFLSGANAAITGDLLTTYGITASSDFKLIEELGFKARLMGE